MVQARKGLWSISERAMPVWSKLGNSGLWSISETAMPLSCVWAKLGMAHGQNVRGSLLMAYGL